jgi:hypothetical protein
MGIEYCFDGRLDVCLGGFIEGAKGLPFLMHRVSQLFYIMNKTIHLPLRITE